MNKFNFLIKTTKGLKTNQVKKITENFGFNKRKEYIFATAFNERELKNMISKSFVNSKLDKEKEDNIAYIRKLKIYRGIRHKLGLPVRGQRTHTNAQTNRKLKNIANNNNLDNATISKKKTKTKTKKKLVVKKVKKKLKTKTKK